MSISDGRLVYSSFNVGVRLIDPRTDESTTLHWTWDGRGLIGVLYTGTTPETRTVSVARIDIATGALQELVADARTFDYVP